MAQNVTKIEVTNRVEPKLVSVRSACVADTIGLRRSMEDTYVLKDQFGAKQNGLFCVFDGHGGREMADFVEHRFPKVLVEELNVDKSRPIRDCLISAYLLTDIQSRQAKLKGDSGCTAVTCLLLKSADTSRQLFSANVGDSRAVLCRCGGQANRISKDHTPNDADEKKRIKDLGGLVLNGRVNRSLACSRAFGDHEHKRFISARPYISQTTLTGDEEFLIVACDGLWDVLSDKDAVDFVYRIYKKDTASETQAADALVRMALKRGTRDNVTVMVVFF